MSGGRGGGGREGGRGGQKVREEGGMEGLVAYHFMEFSISRLDNESSDFAYFALALLVVQNLEVHVPANAETVMVATHSPPGESGCASNRQDDWNAGDLPQECRLL